MDFHPNEKAAYTHVIELYIALLKNKKPIMDVQREIASIAAKNGIDDLKLNELQNKAIDRTRDPMTKRHHAYIRHGPKPQA